MALETQTRTIDGYEIRCTPMRQRDAAKMLARLMKYAGVALAELRKVPLDAVGNSLLDFAAFLPAVSVLLVQMGPDEFDAIACALLKQCQVIVRRDEQVTKYELADAKNIDQAFEGAMGPYLKAIAYVLEVHYAGFIRDLVFGADAASTSASPAE